MRYMIIRYVQRPNGQIDESVVVSNNVKKRDWSEASVIIDFRKRKIEKASLAGQTIPRDWDQIVTYYYRHYASTIDRLCAENGYSIETQEKTENVTSVDNSVPNDRPTEKETETTRSGSNANEGQSNTN